MRRGEGSRLGVGAAFPASCCRRPAEGRREDQWAACTAPEADSDLAGGVLGEGVAQRRLVEAPPVGAEVIIVVHVVQHFTGQLLQS